MESKQGEGAEFTIVLRNEAKYDISTAFFSPLIQVLSLNSFIHPELYTFLPFTKISLKLLSVLLLRRFQPCRGNPFITITVTQNAFQHNSIVSSNHGFYF